MYLICFLHRSLILDITYDAKKDEEEKLEKKQRQLENIEEARKREEDAKKKGEFYAILKKSCFFLEKEFS